MNSTQLRRLVVVLAAGTVAAGCMPKMARKHDDFDALMAAYRKESAVAGLRHDSLLQAQVHSVTVIKAQGDTIGLVSVDVHEAPLSAVVQRVLDQAHAPVIFQKVALRGRVTARFTRLPLVTALNIMMGSYGYSAAVDSSGVVVIRYGATPVAGGDPTEIITAQVPINYIQGERVDDMLRSLLPADRVRYAYQRPTSTITIIGKRQDVEESTSLLRQADQEAPHVLIEVLVVEFDRQVLERFGIDLTELSIGNFSEVAVLLGEIQDAALSGRRKYGQNNPKSYRAFIDALAATDDARLIARPYVTTRSGEEATIEISTDQSIIVQTVENGAAVASMRDVSAGVMLHITPWVLPADEVRVGVDVVESSFLPTSGNVAVVRDKNHATTVMQVPSGKTIVIGGLALDRRTNSNAGVPLLRRIPLLNLLFSKQQRTVKNQEVVIFITPHIWNPSMDPPLQLPGAFGVKSAEKALRQ